MERVCGIATDAYFAVVLPITNSMKLDHIALWVDDLDTMRAFYETYFGATSGPVYTNSVKQFSSYFLTFGSGQARIELMHRPDVSAAVTQRGFTAGLAHFAVSIGSREAVDALTERLRADGYAIAGEPRTTGDGYYESVVLDPEENTIEITV